jgi:hypothetical protein
MSEPGECNLSKAVCRITIDLVQAMALEREFLKAQLQERDQDISRLREQRVETSSTTGRPPNTHQPDPALRERSETTYLRIIGGLLMLLLERSTSGQQHRTFTTQESIISALVDQYGTLPGISERTLLAKFAAAKRALTRD